MSISTRPTLKMVRPYSPPTAVESDNIAEMLLATIRLLRLGYSHSVIVREIFGDSPRQRATGRWALRRLRRLGFSVRAERSGKTEFSKRLAALIREMAGRTDYEIDRAIDDLLHADESDVRRLLARRWRHRGRKRTSS